MSQPFRHLDLLPRKQEGGVAAHDPIQAIEEEPTQIGGRRELADPLDVSLPAQQGSCSQPAVLRHVIDLLDPGPQTLVQLQERKRSLGIEVGQELFSNRAEVALDFSPPFRLIRWRVNDQDANGCGNARQLGAAIDLGIVHIEMNGYAARGDRLPQAIEESIQPLLGIKRSDGWHRPGWHTRRLASVRRRRAGRRARTAGPIAKVGC